MHFDQDQSILDVGLRFLPIRLTATVVCRGAITHPHQLQEVVMGSAVATTAPLATPPTLQPPPCHHLPRITFPLLLIISMGEVLKACSVSVMMNEQTGGAVIVQPFKPVPWT
ncbi:uncharacterized [Tachysurus ichikawai]